MSKSTLQSVPSKTIFWNPRILIGPGKDLHICRQKKCPIKPTKFVFLVKYKLSIILEYPHIFRHIYNLLTISRCSVNKILERLWSDSVSEEGITSDRLYEESYGSYWNESDSSDHNVIRSRVGRSEMFRTSFFFLCLVFYIWVCA